VEHHRVPPHSNGNSVISECQTISAYEKSLRIWEEPDRKNAHEIDEVTKVRQEIMISSFVVGIISYRHEVK